MPLHIALTGATGFVGKALVPRLLSAGHHVKALARDPSRAPTLQNFQVITGSLSDIETLNQLVRGCDVVLHVAGAVSGLNADSFMQANFHGTNAIALAARQQGVKRFVYVSSLAATQPQLGPYGKSKAIAEQSLQVIFAEQQLLVLRPGAVYGPGDTATLPLLQALLSPTAIIPGTPHNRFAMIHVEDLANILAEAASGHASGIRELDDTQGGHSWPELMQLTQRQFGTPRRPIYLPRMLAMAIGYGGDALTALLRRPSMVRSHQMRQLYHHSWLCAAPGWPRSNPIPIEQGLPETIGWYQSQGLLPRTPRIDRSNPEKPDQAPS